MIEEMRAKGSPLMVLELGDFMEEDPNKAPIINPFILDTMEEDGMQAMTPGVRELRHWSEFESLMAGRSIQLISSNIKLKTEQGPVQIGDRTAVIEVGGVRVGLIGVMAKAQFDKIKPSPEKEFEFQDPLEAIEELTPALSAESDLIVVMASIEDKPATELAKNLTSVDVLLGGHFSIASLRPLLKGNVIVSRCGLRGQYFAVTRLIVSPENEIIEWFGENYPLDVDHFAADSSMVERVESMATAARKARLDAIRSRTSQTRRGAPAPAGQNQSSSSGGPTSQAVSSSQSSSLDRFLGAENCQNCHGDIFDSWQKTDHAAVFARWDQTDLASLYRYVTDPNSHRNGATNLTGVQCEACHGPGSNHGRGPFATAVTEKTCERCHQTGPSDGWSYQEALASVRH